MQDFKTGHLVGTAPRAQFQGQLIGSLFSIFVTTTAFSFYSSAYTIPGPEFPAPTAYVWLNLARLLRSNRLPDRVDTFMGVFGIIAAVAGCTKAFATRNGRSPRWLRWMPSGVAFAVGMLNTPNFSLSRLIGGITEAWWRRKYYKLRQRDDGVDEDWEDDTGLGEVEIVIIASGFVLGEGVASIVNLIMKVMGISHASCWGCAEGICSGCS